MLQRTEFMTCNQLHSNTKMTTNNKAHKKNLSPPESHRRHRQTLLLHLLPSLSHSGMRVFWIRLATSLRFGGRRRVDFPGAAAWCSGLHSNCRHAPVAVAPRFLPHFTIPRLPSMLRAMTGRVVCLLSVGVLVMVSAPCVRRDEQAE
jgi:hypothetical protein